MAEFQHNGITFHYEARGEGIPFIFLHGLGNDYMHAYDTIDEQEGVRLISLDQHGHGQSGFRWDIMDFDTMGDDIIALAEHLELDRFYLGGISMGAGVSVNVAVRYPERVRGIFLVRNAWLDGPMEPNIVNGFALVDRYIGMKDGREKYLADPEVQQFRQEMPGCAKAFLNYFDSESCVRMHRKFAVMPEKQPIRDRSQLQKLSVPTLVVACKNDPIHPFEYGEWYAGQIPGAQFLEIPAKAADSAAYHSRLNAAIQKFIREEEVIESAGILSALSLTGEERQQAKRDMVRMIGYVDQLKELDTDGVEPMYHIYPGNNVFREDEVTNDDGQEDIQAGAPGGVKDGCLKVPRTVESEVESAVETGKTTEEQETT